MKFSYNWLKQYVDFDKKPRELAELLTLYAFEVEEVIEKEGDWILDIDVLPNRAADCFSHLGVAREIKAILNIKEDRSLELNKPEQKDLGAPEGEAKIEVKDSSLCPRYSLGIMEQIAVGESPAWLRRYLQACGLEPICNIVDIANFVMLEYGQPLHAFDADKIAGDKIYVRCAKKGEKIQTLDNKSYKLNTDTLVIADKEGPCAIAGIKGGKKAAVTKDTKRIYIEAASFNPSNIRRSSRRLKLESDASKRFSQGLSAEFTRQGLARFVHLASKHAGGKYAGWQNCYPKKEKQLSVPFLLAEINELVGVAVENDFVKDVFKNLEFKVNQKSKEIYKITPPYFRKDITIKEDLAEEVARLYGYQNISSQFPRLALVHPERCELSFWRSQIKNILTGFGYSEVMNFSFIGKEEAVEVGVDAEELLELANPLSADLYYLRPNLGFSLLKSLRKESRNLDIIRIFEMGKRMHKKAGKVQERWQLGVLVDVGETKPASFYELKGAIDSLLSEVGIREGYFDDADVKPDPLTPFWHKGRKAEVRVDEEKMGVMGEIKPYLLDAIGCKSCAAMALLDVEMLAKLAEEGWEYHPPRKFPAVTRDLAILVDQKVRFSKVLSVINSLAVEFVRDVDLFDVYEGEELPEGKKNFAFHIIYASDERTLTDEEVTDEHKQIEHALEKELDAEVR